MAAKNKITSEALKDLLHPESFESESILSDKNQVQTDRIVTLDELVPWNRNPRIFRNPKYDEIKDSIRAKGLEVEPGITQKPGDTHYMIKAGGNTRLQILKELVAEIDAEIAQITSSGTPEDKDRIPELNRKRDSFYRIKCKYTPWDESQEDVDSEIDLLAGHMVENEMRGEMNFIERALAVVRFRRLFEEKEGRELSARGLADMIKAKGWPANHAAILRYEYAANKLFDFLPEAFEHGMGFSIVKRLRKYHTCVEQLWEHAEVEGKSISGWEKIWEEALAECDGEVFDFNRLTDRIEARLAQALNCNITQITAELFRLGQKDAVPAESLLNRTEEGSVTPFAVPGSNAGNNSKHNPAATGEAGGRDADRYLNYEDHPSDFTELPSNTSIAAKLKELQQKAAAKKAQKENNSAAASSSVSTGSSSGSNRTATQNTQEISPTPAPAGEQVNVNVWTVPEGSYDYLLSFPLSLDQDLISIKVINILKGYVCDSVRYLMEKINDIYKELNITGSDYMQLIEIPSFYPAFHDIQHNGLISGETMKSLKQTTGLNEDEIAKYAEVFWCTDNIGYVIKTNPDVITGTLSQLVAQKLINDTSALMLTKLTISIICNPYKYFPETDEALRFIEDRNSGKQPQDIWHKGRIIEEVATGIAGYGLEKTHLYLLLAESEVMGQELFADHKKHAGMLDRLCYRIEEIHMAIEAKNGGEA